MKFKELPDACKTLSKDTVKKLDAEDGERVAASASAPATPRSPGSCLWSGLDKFDYRQLTVSLKRFESDASRGSATSCAGAFSASRRDALKSDKANKDLKSGRSSGIGDQATTISYKTEKKDGKDSENFTRGARHRPHAPTSW